MVVGERERERGAVRGRKAKGGQLYKGERGGSKENGQLIGSERLMGDSGDGLRTSFISFSNSLFLFAFA
jgi:hypothetical protein